MTIDLRSDTVTKPTAQMRAVMAKADVGDDVYGEDPTVRSLEYRLAELAGHEAGLFVPSGTMGNQIAIYTHTQRGDEVILDRNAHLFFYEVGGMAALSGVQARTYEGQPLLPSRSSLKEFIRVEDLHFPTTRLLALENTLNRAGGRILPQSEVDDLIAWAQENGVKTHLDGARVFNAAVAQSKPLSDLTKGFSSVMICLSKGLAAPVGSLLLGDQVFIKKARKTRKLFGGGMRQAGILAAAGLYALEHHVERLAEDHAHARLLAEAACVDPALVDTNMVMLQVKDAAMTVQWLKHEGILVNSMGPELVRLVTHLDVTEQDANVAAGILARGRRDGLI